MDAVRQANIYPTCRLDKSSRAVYEPEDVWAKRAALVKPETRSSVGNSRARGMFKQKVLAISTTGVTKANMDAVDRVKEVGKSVMVGNMFIMTPANVRIAWRLPVETSSQCCRSKVGTGVHDVAVPLLMLSLT